MNQKRAFTLIEVMVVVIIGALVSGVLYKIMAGTFGTYFKTQTKLTNLRAGSILLEYLKTDLRLATADQPDSDISDDEFSYKFKIRKDNTLIPVTYQYSKGTVHRIGDTSDRIISQAKVASFSITEESNSFGKYIKINIVVDDEKDDAKRTTSSRANNVTLRAVLFPKFFKTSGQIDPAEKYWNAARSSGTTGGTS
ncbi:MAG TPA: prepilin-type N-terminal cleavage/methylation domain-containing protein [Candidatus Ozemobacteraceae bacterium]